MAIRHEQPYERDNASVELASLTREGQDRTLDLAEPDGTLSAFLLRPAPGLLERQARYGTRHAALISEILDLLPPDQREPAGPGGRSGARC